MKSLAKPMSVFNNTYGCPFTLIGVHVKAVLNFIILYPYSVKKLKYSELLSALTYLHLNSSQILLKSGT